MESRQKLTLPADRYPLKITSLRVTAGSEVRRDDVLGIYEYDNNNPQEAGNATATTSRKRTVREEWRSPYSGRVDEVCVKEGEVVVGVRKTLAVIIEPCGHAIQVHGICATCGKDVSIGTYMGNDLGRATINMAHDNRGVTISRDVAVKLDNERSERLLVSKKLTLILDLDQTLVHATVDPTVAQWMDDPSNPNQQFLKDVHKFEIPSYHTHFVKLRPGTREFLLEMNEIYELHIYTMGSRQYADQIANILDQDRALFKDRIISRDENRSNFKSIQRLFPSDQSMVVIVDDRSDIWHWSPNLYKILPFNFFVGTGDINAPRLPPSGPPQTPQAASKPAIPDKDHDTVTSLEKELSDEDVQHQFLEDLEKTRPLERLSEELDAEGETQGITGVDADAMDVVSAKEEKENAVSDTPPTPKPASPPPTSSSSSSSTPPAPPTAPPKRRPSLRTKPILTDSDRELDRVCKVLKDVHRAFYSGAVEESRRLGVGGIMARQKKAVLAGVRIVFSGVISTDVDGRTTDIWVGAEQFGAKCVFDLSDDVTHLVTVKQQGLNKTNKVRRARKMPGVFIVSLDW
ncbi:uncharacterized protein EV422DRAFT_520485 [Fimicolochytrium jonesii]|uniref:uncharacterized protein n=1 Tax=Fimicolochytrium jonesii TaxID=1396493 RepID=UPI0022FF05AD|nr:uncharacterized protein EV422DRAFT_520485 [Fimicolochytrium jonesii]KAI8824554.1 hypothetical protein EV422DRAFT_520485 [Fimicolochytrium jonesii]